MKDLIKLSLSLLLLLGLSACATSPREGAANEDREEPAMSTVELEAQFTANHLSDERLKALEERARQKLLDFVDYVNLMGDPALDSTFREQAEEQVRELFRGAPVEIRLVNDPVPLEAFLINLQRGENKVSYQARSIEVATPLRRASEEQYRGRLTFAQRTMVDEQEAEQAREVDIRVEKVAKQFGKEQQLVWEVFLGSIM